MKSKFTGILLLLLSFSVFSQDIKIGIENGINFSNLYGDLYEGKWIAQPGPVNGIYMQYHLSEWFALQSGLNYTSLYYNHIPNQYQYNVDFWKFSFLRMPLLFKLKTPGKLSFEMGAGLYYSFFVNDEFTGKEKKRYKDFFGIEGLYPSTDWGWIFSAGLNYSVTNRLEIKLTSQTTIGKKEYIYDVKGKNGSNELLLGIGYKLITKKSNRSVLNSDSILSMIEIMPHSGFVFGKSSNPDYKENYLMSPGFEAGVSVKYKNDRTFSIISGMWFERKSYGLNYNGESGFLYLPHDDNKTNPKIDTHTSLDYLTFPFLFDFTFGNSLTISVNVGFYYSRLLNAMVRGEYISTYSNEKYYAVNKKYIFDKVNGSFKNYDVGGVAGIRVEYPVFQETRAFFGINYSNGLMNVLRNENDNQSFGSDQKIINSSWSVNVGFVFPVHQTN